ncbi:ABC transporter ATP-binding protein [Cohnella sp. WQ 127256]|uniref:ABC transporter ATP-binding protein n=1 Tax=Cohnella sp. WQ 127256 TaxID=2938790 RepID=UPI0021183D8D|nr:ABC transporter ATP-binding protein [Cohnella sp. WQ 127256]
MDILQMNEISKVYGNGIYANRRVNFSVCEGEIHALVGENGAGKSTLMKVLFGLEKPDSGQIIVKGTPVSFQSPQDAMAIGIGMVHQHFMLVPSLSVTENVTLGFEPMGKAFIDRKTARKKVQELSDTFDLKIDLDMPASKLAVGIKQKVEILKALYRGARILILDEPTAVLTPQETVELFIQLKALKEKGFTVIFISHKLREIKQLTDRVSVMRRGELVASVNTEDVSEEEISSMMIGGGYSGHIVKSPAVPKENLVEIKDVKWKDRNSVPVVNGVTFSVRAGEIVGIAGVEGNGQDELIEMITGLKRYDSGEIQMFGSSIKNEEISSLRERGMSYIPSDRMTLGVATSMSIENNLISTKINDPSIYSGKLLSASKIAQLSAKLVSDFRIKCGSSKTEVSMLSGGNIQKVVVAREFTQNARLIIAEQPTRGIDVGAAEFIHNKLVELRDSGCGVLLVSADLDELTKLSDSIIVLHNGQISAYIENVSAVSEIELGHYMLGVNKQSASDIGRAYHTK